MQIQVELQSNGFLKKTLLRVHGLQQVQPKKERSFQEPQTTSIVLARALQTDCTDNARNQDHSYLRWAARVYTGRQHTKIKILLYQIASTFYAHLHDQ